MSLHEAIERRLRGAFEPSHLEVINESGMHNVAPDSETHFRVVVVSSRFEALPRVQRHRLVYEALAEERAAGVHALGIQTLTPGELAGSRQTVSPPCTGGDGAREPGGGET